MRLLVRPLYGRTLKRRELYKWKMDIEKASISAAAVTRGLGAPVKRTNVCEIGFQSKDYVIIAVTLVLSILYIYLSV